MAVLMAVKKDGQQRAVKQDGHANFHLAKLRQLLAKLRSVVAQAPRDCCLSYRQLLAKLREHCQLPFAYPS